jgi:hypothetical protein
MSVALLSYARISGNGLNQVWAEGGRVQSRLTSWRELGASAIDISGLPALKGRFFSKGPSSRSGRMDLLCKLGLGVSELCIEHAPELTRQDVALVGGSMLGCIETDAQYHDTLLKNGPAGASPALYVYTLPSMFLGEIAIKFGFRGRTSFINAGTLSAVAALANGVRLIEKGRAPAVLVVAAEAAGAATRELDLKALGQSGACAWLLVNEGVAICTLGNVRFGSDDGELLVEGEEGYGLTYLDDLQDALLCNTDNSLRCGDGANAISLDVNFL